MVAPGSADTVLLAFSKDLFEKLRPTGLTSNNETVDIYIYICVGCEYIF